MHARSILFVAGLLASAAPITAQTTTIDNVTIVDVTNGRLQPRKTIVIDGNRIARIDDATAATHAAATLDGTGMFVIPGLWDMHVHAYFTNDTARFHGTSEVMFPLFIVNGITGVRDLGSNLDATLAARDSVAAHQLIGPRMMVSGPMIDGPTTRYAAAIKVATIDSANCRSAVRIRIRSSGFVNRRIKATTTKTSTTHGKVVPMPVAERISCQKVMCHSRRIQYGRIT